MIVGYSALGVGGITIGLLPLITFLATHPFAAGYDGLDHFYPTLGLTRKFVVAGRYFFALVIGVSMTAIFFVLGVIAATILGDAVSLVDFAMVLLASFLLTSIVVAFNLTLLFKLGFRAARFFATTFPLFLLMGIMFLINTFGGWSLDFISQLSHELSRFSFGGIFNPIIILIAIIWSLLMGLSYFLSLKFYIRRDF